MKEKVNAKSTKQISPEKYVVERLDRGQWVCGNEFFSKPMNRGRAACVFFAQWLGMHEAKFTLDEVRNVFPISLNKFYENRKWDFIDTLIYGSEADSLMANVINKAGQIIQLRDHLWDFYPIKLGPRKCGWGYLKDLEYMAVMPKRWNKEDFQRLLDHIDANPNLFEGIRIRQI